MTLPHESKEGSPQQGEAKEAPATTGTTVNVGEAEDVKVEGATGGAVQADDQGHAAEPADQQAE